MSYETIEPAAPQTKTRTRRWLRPALGLVLVALLALTPQLVPRDDLINLLFLVFLYISLGQSWNILAGFAGQTAGDVPTQPDVSPL